MPTALKVGLADHGQPVSLDEFDAAEFEEGYKYELIAGRLFVSPQANFVQHWLERWLVRQFDQYADARPEVLGFVATKGRVYLPDAADATVPEPDFSLYREVPAGTVEDIHWPLMLPFVVGEVLTTDDGADKDFVRNPALFIQVPSVQEYWVLDGRGQATRATLHVFVRDGDQWAAREYATGETFETALLPGFSLRIAPRR